MDNELLSLYEQYVNSNYLNDLKLPNWLVKFTAGNKLCQCFHQAVDQLIESKRYEEASVYLKFLIEQDGYCTNEIDEIYLKLIDVLDRRLNKSNEAFMYCNNALNLSLNFKNGPALKIQAKQTEIANRLNNSFVNPLADILNVVVVVDLAHQIDEMKRLNKESKKNVPETFVIEEVSINYYKENSEYDEGLRGQNEFFNLIFFNLFYNEIYHSIDDVFRYRLQRYPVDYDSPAFIDSRRKLFEARLEYLGTRTLKQICDEISDQRTKNKCLKAITKFHSTSFDSLRQVIYCLKKDNFIKILSYLISNYLSCRDACPTLIIWNDETRTIKFVECKKQDNELDLEKFFWIKFFKSINIDAEICNVSM